MRRSWMRGFALVLGLALAVSGCDKTPLGSSSGTIEGSITITPANVINFNGWRAQVYTSMDNWARDLGESSATITGSNGSFSFRIDNLAPGTYYADICHVAQQVCLSFNASDPMEGLPDPFQVQAGATTRLQLTLQGN